MSTLRQFNTPISLSSAALSATHNSNTVANIFTTGGNVGIGTTTPNYTLDVNGELEASNSNGLMLFGTSGNVFIGSTTPTPSAFGRGNLMLYGSNVTNSGIAMDGVCNTTLQFFNSGTMKGALALVATAGNWAPDSRVGDMVIRCATNQSMLFNTNSGTGVSTMIISGGNVGIGTTSPTTKLDVTGDLRVTTSLTTGALYSTNQTSTNIVATASTITNLSIPGTLTVVNITSTNLVETNITAATIIVTGGSFRGTFNSNTLGSLFTTGGNIGIGTTSPQNTLHVHNPAGAADVRVIISDSSIGASMSRGLHLIKNGAQNSYVYSYEAGFLQLGSNNTAIMTLASNGNVVIGTGITPRSKLDVDGDIITDWNSRFIGTRFQTGTEYNLGILTNINNRSLDIRSMAADSTGSVTISTGPGPTERVRITNTGNVGIGTSSPTSPLTVNGNLGIACNSTSSGLSLGNSNSFSLANYDAQNANTPSIFNVFGGDVNYQAYWGHSFQIGAGGGGDSFSASQARISGTSSFTVNKWTSNGVFSNLFTIRNSGYVGIGTTAPREEFHIYSSTTSANIILTGYSNNTAGSTGIYFQNDNDPAQSRHKSAILAVGSGGWGRSDLYFSLNNQTDATSARLSDTRMVILNSGNVGIGTTSPSYTLDINGTQRLYSSNGVQMSLSTANGIFATIEAFTAGNTAKLPLCLNPYGANVGIGTTSPSGTLVIQNGSSNIINNILDGSYWRTYVSSGNAGVSIVYNYQSGKNVYWGEAGDTGSYIFRGRTLGIGVDPSGTSVLQVASGSGNYNFPTSGYYFNTTTTITFAGSGWAPNNSILAAGGITSNTGFYASSDIRIKKIVKQGIHEIDISQIDKIDITKFEYIDKLVHGNDVKLGFIAQNVHEFIPEAVTLRKEFVPNIFKVTSVNGKVIELTGHNLTVGTRIKIMVDEQDRNGTVTEITNIIDENHFCIEYDLENKDKLFIYGTEVDDFKELNYNHIFTLSVGAVQKLRQDVKTLEHKFDKLMAFIQDKFPNETIF